MIAGTCGVQDSLQGSVTLALNACIDGPAPQHLERYLLTERPLLSLWCMRGAPYWVPAAGSGIFTTGLLPDSDDACAFFIRGAGEHFRKLRLTASEAVALTADALSTVLAGRNLNKDQIGRELAAQLETRVPQDSRLTWRTADGLGQNTYRESLVRYALYVVSLQGTGSCSALTRFLRQFHLRYGKR